MKLKPQGTKKVLGPPLFTGNFYDGFHSPCRCWSYCPKMKVTGPRAALGWAHSATQVDNKGVCPWPVDLLPAPPGDSQVWRGRGNVLIPLIDAHRNRECIVISNHRLIRPYLGHHCSCFSLSLSPISSYTPCVSTSVCTSFPSIGQLIIKLASRIPEGTPKGL